MLILNKKYFCSLRTRIFKLTRFCLPIDLLRLVYIFLKKYRLSIKYKIVNFSSFRCAELIDVIFPNQKLSFRLGSVGANKSEILNLQYYKFDCEYKYEAPSVKLFLFKKFSVIGRFDFIFGNGFAAACDHYLPKKHLTYSEMHNLCFVRNNVVSTKRYKSNLKTINRAIWLSGGASNNYIHWLTEFIPRLVAIDRLLDYTDIPIIIDSELHPNLLECLALVNIHNRQIIEIRMDEMVFIHNLFVVDNAFYSPFDWKQDVHISPGKITPNVVFTNFANMQAVRDLLFRNLNIRDGIMRSRKRVFILRSSKFRTIVNQNMLRKMLEKLGFICVDPSKMSFVDQVRFFSKVDLLIAQGGASLGNIMFLPQGAKVVVLSMFSPYVIPYYFSLYGASFNILVNFFICTPVLEKNTHRAHRSMFISLVDFKKYLNEKGFI